MTTRGSKLVSEIQERYLECNICTEIFDEYERIPKLLPCLHTFCLTCLKALYKKDRIKCPTCNGLYKLTKREFKDLPKDNTRRDLTSFIQVQIRPDNECSNCGNCVSELYCCYDCDKYFCSKCCKLHKQNFSSHNVQELNDETSNVCKIAGHDNSPLKFFCKGPLCETVICANCALSDHRDQGKHNLEDVKQTIDQRKDRLKTAVAALRRQINTVKVIEKTCKEKDISLCKDKEKFCTNVERIYDNGVHALNSKKEFILQSYKKLIKEQEESIMNTKEKTSPYIQNAEECCNITERLLSDSGIKSFLAVDKTLNNRIQEFVDKSFENVEFNDKAGLHSLHGDVTSFEQSVKELKDSLKTTKSGCVNGYDFLKDILKKRFTCPEPKQILNICIRTVKRVRGSIYETFFEEPEQETFLDRLKRTSKVFIPIMILIAMAMLPANMFISSNYFVNSTFNTKPESSFVCRSFDNKTVSTIPDSYSRTCGSKDAFFKYKGVFADKEFISYKSHNLDLVVRFQEHFLADSDYEGLVLFEFGMTPKSVNTGYLFESSILTLTAYSCRNVYSVCISIDNGRNNPLSLNNIFIAEGNSNYMKGKFTIRIRPERGIISFISKTVEPILLYKFTNVLIESSLFGVFAMYEREKISVSMSLSTDNSIQFDRSTLHPSLYISSDNKTFSNRPTSYTRLNERKNNRYVYAAPLLTASYEHIYTVVNIEFTHIDGLKHGTKMFEIGVGSNKNRKFYEDLKFECFICRITRYRIFDGSGYCLQSKDGLTIIKQNFIIIMHYHITKNKLSFYIPNTEGGRSYYIYTYTNFDWVLPTFYIGKMDSQDITASWTKDVLLYESAWLLFSDWYYS
ncbi:Hypothetical predicted protein [Mytilus galloprovincialis]|uniref:RING-type domain-containing protein n=1 Tax=Mytilus galloprovincialis TaxID=29158 RepID=A0A8B6D7N3_MYTGA|nr:Hypothetical predicted protein [Mytilus galloprovincialis]